MSAIFWIGVGFVAGLALCWALDHRDKVRAIVARVRAMLGKDV